MAYPKAGVDIDDFFERLSEDGFNGVLNYTRYENRLDYANHAVEAIKTAGSVISGSNHNLFTHAMVGLPDFSMPDEYREQYQPFVSGLWSLAGQFSGLTADVPFVPGRTVGGNPSKFKAGGFKKNLPSWVYVRGREPYARMPEGWGLDVAHTSLEYQVLRSSITNIVVGRIIARGCIGVSLEGIINHQHRGEVNRISTRKADVVLYQASRNVAELPDEMPAVNLAKFGLAIFSKEDRSYAEIEALNTVVKAAQHRGDYNGLPTTGTIDY